jgi:hypothetical protein
MGGAARSSDRAGGQFQAMAESRRSMVRTAFGFWPGAGQGTELKHMVCKRRRHSADPFSTSAPILRLR